MGPPHPALEIWAQWWNELDGFTTILKRSKGEFVSQKTLREQAKLAVQNYFRAVRPQLIDLGNL